MPLRCRRLWAALVACAAAACSGNLGPPVRIVLAHATNADARCVVPMKAPLADEGLQGVNLGDGLTVATVRLTLRVQPRYAANTRADGATMSRIGPGAGSPRASTRPSYERRDSMPVTFWPSTAGTSASKTADVLGRRTPGFRL